MAVNSFMNPCNLVISTKTKETLLLFIYLFMYTATSVEVIAGVDYTTKNMSRENNKREHIQQHNDSPETPNIKGSQLSRVL